MKALHTMMFASAMTAAALASPFAAAHASLKHSNPEAGSTLAAAPNVITLTFNEKVAEAFSTIALVDAEGKAIAASKAKVDAANPAILHLEIPALSAGAYSVNWAAAGHDGHRRKGSFKFTVK